MHVGRRRAENSIIALFFLLGPCTVPTDNGVHVGVAHLLQIVCSQCWAVATATIQVDRGVGIESEGVDIAFYDAASQMNSATDMPLGPFMIFSHIDQKTMVCL